ncbi:MAG: hypothetical protein R3279_00210 [Putridiphycobacter sp.]|nr:hypothetical protein [Putridiphycobacter sp.]
MKGLKLLAILLIAGVAISGCQKIENYDQLSRLIDKEWRLVSITKNGTELADSCQLDNTIVFSTNGEITTDFGAVSCEEELSFQDWKFQKEYAQIRFKGRTKGDGFSFASYIEQREILELTEKALVLKETYPNGGQEMPRVFTYQVQ